MTAPLLLHGGVGGLWRGSSILPGMSAHRHVAGCKMCEAQRDGTASARGWDPETPNGWVYATADREYARYYASRAVRGSLYRVRLEGDVEPSTEDPFPTWRGRSATVLAALEFNITLTMKQRQHLFVRWGGTRDEFETMLAGMRVATP